MLVKNRLVRKMDVGDGYSLYEPRLDNDHHDHMICEDTGDIIEFFSEELELLQESKHCLRQFWLGTPLDPAMIHKPLNHTVIMLRRLV